MKAWGIQGKKAAADAAAFVISNRPPEEDTALQALSIMATAHIENPRELFGENNPIAGKDLSKKPMSGRLSTKRLATEEDGLKNSDNNNAMSSININVKMTGIPHEIVGINNSNLGSNGITFTKTGNNNSIGNPSKRRKSAAGGKGRLEEETPGIGEGDIQGKADTSSSSKRASINPLADSHTKTTNDSIEESGENAGSGKENTEDVTSSDPSKWPDLYGNWQYNYLQLMQMYGNYGMYPYNMMYNNPALAVMYGSNPSLYPYSAAAAAAYANFVPGAGNGNVTGTGSTGTGTGTSVSPGMSMARSSETKFVSEISANIVTDNVEDFVSELNRMGRIGGYRVVLKKAVEKKALIQCVRGGSEDNTTTSSLDPVWKKCNCPFKVVIRLGKNKKWLLRNATAEHNHEKYLDMLQQDQQKSSLDVIKNEPGNSKNDSNNNTSNSISNNINSESISEGNNSNTTSNDNMNTNSSNNNNNNNKNNSNSISNGTFNAIINSNTNNTHAVNSSSDKDNADDDGLISLNSDSDESSSESELESDSNFDSDSDDDSSLSQIGDMTTKGGMNLVGGFNGGIGFVSQIPLELMADTVQDFVLKLNDLSKDNGYAVFLKRQDKYKASILCDRSGSYVSKSKGMRKKSSKKCNCPFKITIRRMKPEGPWKVSHTRPRHNHEMSRNPGYHVSHRKLSAVVKSQIVEMFKLTMRPSQIWRVLREENVLCTRKDVSNIIDRYRTSVKKKNGEHNVSSTSSLGHTVLGGSNIISNSNDTRPFDLDDDSYVDSDSDGEMELVNDDSDMSDVEIGTSLRYVDRILSPDEIEALLACSNTDLPVRSIIKVIRDPVIKKERKSIKTSDEPIYSCSQCHQKGHNKRSCSATLVGNVLVPSNNPRKSVGETGASRAKGRQAKGENGGATTSLNSTSVAATNAANAANAASAAAIMMAMPFGMAAAASVTTGAGKHGNNGRMPRGVHAANTTTITPGVVGHNLPQIVHE